MGKNRTGKIIYIFIMLLLSCIMPCVISGTTAMTSYAADYHIGAADWEYDGSGRVLAIWDEASDKTEYELAIYRGSIRESNKVYKERLKVNVPYHDFSFTIAKHGTGTYYYTVYPVKGGASMMVVSAAFYVDGDMLKAIREHSSYNATNDKKNTSSRTAINLETPLGWTMLPNGTWRYRLSTNTFATNQWLRVNGKWYYFGADGIMLTGWQNIGGRYFYFEGSGALWTGGAKGADGSLAGGSASGESAGTHNTGTATTGITGSAQTSMRTVTTDNEQHVYTGNTGQLMSLNVTFKEDEAEPGKVRPMTVIVPSSVELVSVNYGVQPAKWSPGTKTNVTVTVKAKGNYQFGSGLKVSCSNGTFKSQSGDAFTRTIRCEYLAKAKLAKPERVYLDGNSLVKWSRVSGAARYNVVISYDEEYTYNPADNAEDMTLYIDETEDELRYNGRNRSITVYETQIDASDYIGIDELKRVKFHIVAMAVPTRVEYYLNSEAALFTAEQGLTESSTNIGSLTTNKSGATVYIGSDGDYITGWQDIGGAWYYFEGNGAAAGPGWKQIERRWYYFGDDHKMRTGWIELDGHWYYLNEGADDIYGAMLTGTQLINSTSYHLNDGKTAGLPLGAWVESRT